MYADGSPFAFDEDVASLDSYDSPVYVILSTPEFPPFITFAETFENAKDRDGKVIHGDIHSFLNILRAQGQQPRFLSETTQQSLAQALEQAELNPKKCAEDCAGAFPELRDYFRT